MRSLNCCFFFFNDTATTEIYTLSLHDALPICSIAERVRSASCSSDGGACSSAFSTGCRYVWLARDRRTGPCSRSISTEYSRGGRTGGTTADRRAACSPGTSCLTNLGRLCQSARDGLQRINQEGTMRILMFAQFYPPSIGGEERHVRDLGIELAARGHDVSLATLWHNSLPDFEIDQGPRIHRIHATMQRRRVLSS